MIETKAKLRMRLAATIEDLITEKSMRSAMRAELAMTEWALRELRSYAQDHREDPYRICGYVLGITSRWAMSGDLAAPRGVDPDADWRGHKRV